MAREEQSMPIRGVEQDEEHSPAPCECLSRGRGGSPSQVQSAVTPEQTFRLALRKGQRVGIENGNGRID